MWFESLDEREAFDVLVHELQHEFKHTLDTAFIKRGENPSLESLKRKETLREMFKLAKFGENKAENPPVYQLRRDMSQEYQCIVFF